MTYRTGSGPFASTFSRCASTFSRCPLNVAGRYRRRGIATWLLGRAADWLELAQVDRLLDYAHLEGRDAAGRDYAGDRAFLSASGFRELTRTARGWTRSGLADGLRAGRPGPR